MGLQNGFQLASGLPSLPSGIFVQVASRFLSLWHNTRSQNWDRKTFKTPFPDHGPLPCKCLADWVRLALLAPRSSRPLLVRSGFSLGLRSQNWVRIAVPKSGLPLCKINRILINGLETRFQNMEPKTDPKLEPRPDRQAQISSAPAKDFWSAAAPPWRWPRDPRASTNWRGPRSRNGFLSFFSGPKFTPKNGHVCSLVRVFISLLGQSAGLQKNCLQKFPDSGEKSD